MKQVAVTGIGMTKFGEIWDRSLRDLSLEASLLAIKDAGLKANDIDAVFFANMLGSRTSGQSQLGSLMTSLLGIKVDAVRIEAACASGGMAVLRASESIKSGRYRNVLVVGAEKMTDIDQVEITSALMEAGDEEQEGTYGATFPTLYALMAYTHMQKYKTSERQLAKVAVKNHYHASMNPLAHFTNLITEDDVLKSSPIATPLKLLDCSPISDGAAAIVLTGNSMLKKKQDPVFFIGSGVATDTLSLAERSTHSAIPVSQNAAKQALAQAHLRHEDIDLIELHDCFTIAEIMALEDMGFYKKGEASDAIEKKETYLGGKLPVNTSGGLKACGHPIGATGVKQIVEITIQLRKKAGKRQVKNAKVGLTHNVGGSGATCVVNILASKDYV